MTQAGAVTGSSRQLCFCLASLHLDFLQGRPRLTKASSSNDKAYIHPSTRQQTAHWIFRQSRSRPDVNDIAPNEASARVGYPSALPNPNREGGGRAARGGTSTQLIHGGAALLTTVKKLCFGTGALLTAQSGSQTCQN